MFEAEPNPSMNELEYDRRLEQLVDSGLWSYDDARRMLGQPPYEIWVEAAMTELRGASLARAALQGLVSIDEVDEGFYEVHSDASSERLRKL